MKVNLLLVSFLLSFILLIAFNVSLSDYEFRNLSLGWFNTHYAINYIEFGFVKRGFIGTFYYFLFDDITQVNLFIFQLFFIVSFIVVSFLFFKKIGMHKNYIYFLFIISPATILQFTSDLPRFDVVLVICFMLSLMFVKKSLILFCLFSCIGVLTHEIYVFSFLPASFLVLINKERTHGNVIPLVIDILKSPAFYFLLSIILLVVIYGKYENGYDELLRLFSSKGISVDPNPKGSIHIWTRTIIENIEKTENRLSFGHAIYSVIVLSVVLVYLRFLGVDFKNPNYYLILIFSLPMFILGTDYARWIAFIFIAIFLTFVILETEKLHSYSKKLPMLASCYGPLGIGGFPSPLMTKVQAILKQFMFL